MNMKDFKVMSTRSKRHMITLVLGSICLIPSAWAQSDSALNRSVTVERDFQPVIQAAGKIATKPTVVETEIESAPIEYSDFTAEVTPGTSITSLLSQPTRFAANEPYSGYVRGALGHPNTLFDFGYKLNDGKNSILRVYANHRAQWGLKALSRTKLGLNFTHTFSTSDLYFGLNGGNIYYHKYGHFYDYKQPDPSAWQRDKITYPNAVFGNKDKTSLWTVEAYFGIKANAKQEVQYKIQTGYMLFSKPGAVSEHQIRTHASFDWHSDAHHVGLNGYVQNNFTQLGSLSQQIADSLYDNRHNFRFEPYYAYDGKRVQIHLGVNLDVNIGRGRNKLSATDNVSFAPSPHVHMEAQVAKQWLTVYLDAKGKFGKGTLQEFMESNRYRMIQAGIVSHHLTGYTPVDGEIGLHIRPYRDLLIELHGGYAYMLDQTTLIAVVDGAHHTPSNTPLIAGDFSYTYNDYTRGKIGGQINYHYRDIIRINLHGDYYFWSAQGHENNHYAYWPETSPKVEALLKDSVRHVYDRANWEMGLRIDGKIDKHWSLYSDNYFAGSRTALATDGEHILRPTIEMDLGLQYDMWVGKAQNPQSAEASIQKSGRNKKKSAIENHQSALGATIMRPEPKPNLSLFFQLNNVLHRKNDIYYGYRGQGINFLMGATFRF